MSDKKCDSKDFVVPGPKIAGTSGQLCIKHCADHTIQLGEMHPLEDGKPLPEDAEFLSKREDSDIYDVHGSVADLKKGKGPSKISTPAYRDGWDQLWGKKVVGQS